MGRVQEARIRLENLTNKHHDVGSRVRPDPRQCQEPSGDLLVGQLLRPPKLFQIDRPHRGGKRTQSLYRGMSGSVSFAFRKLKTNWKL